MLLKILKFFIFIYYDFIIFSYFCEMAKNLTKSYLEFSLFLFTFSFDLRNYVLAPRTWPARFSSYIIDTVNFYVRLRVKHV